MNDKKIEIRTLEGKLAIREQKEGEEGESRTITGRAIVFNSESELLDEYGMRFREIILPEAVTEEWLTTQDVKMNMLHDRQLTVARCNKGEGSLRLEVDDQGVTFEFEAPKCDIGDRCLEMVRRGDYSGCSFEFYPDQYEVEEREDEVLIKHSKFAGLVGLTIGLDPAYTTTYVNARELVKHEEEENDEEARKAEEEAEREQREKEAVAVAKARRNLVRLMDIDSIV